MTGQYGDFDGQQTGERILYIARPHALSKFIAIGKIVLLAIFFLIMTQFIASVVPQVASGVRVLGTVLGALLAFIGIWWNLTVHRKSRTYITDRRIIRFEMVSPFVETKRALFWGEALKVKAYQLNLVYRFLGIGTVEVEPIQGDHENVQSPNLVYFEDLANYIDKILYAFKHKPEDLLTIKPFVTKPKGQRG